MQLPSFMRSARTAIVAVLLAAGCGGPTTRTDSPPEGTFIVRLSRPTSVGDSWIETVQVRKAQRQTTRVGGQPVGDELTGLALELEGDFTALEVDADGDVTRYSVSVRRFVVDAGQGATSPALPGALLVTRGTPGTIESPAGPLDEQTIEWLRDALPTRRSDVDDDAVFGTTEPQPIGGTWGIDTALAAEGLNSVGVGVRHEHLGGQTQLVEATRVDGIDCLLVRSDFSARQITVPNLPAGSEVQRAELRAQMEAMLPIDATLRVPQESVRMAMEVEIAVTTAAGVAFVQLANQEETIRSRRSE